MNAHHLHLDPIGGASGDMFIAALLDLAPEMLEQVQSFVRPLLGDCFSIETGEWQDEVFRGRRFSLTQKTGSPSHRAAPAHRLHRHDHHHHDHSHDHHGHHHHDHQHQPGGHSHRSLADVRGVLQSLAISASARDRAINIYRRLADAEARVHGTTPDQVHFHEIGELDSILDVAICAFLLDSLQVSSASVGALPLGGGHLRTAHGLMAMPGPATLELLKGFRFFDDGIEGERVTPTGAAILAHLEPSAALPQGIRLVAAGYGFGTRRFPKGGNVLRVSLFERAEPMAVEAGRVCVIAFEVDDQTGEDLAIGIERIRATNGVIDVVQWPVFGKKGRVGQHVQILSRAEARSAATAACFRETATIGLRVTLADRETLDRAHASWEGLRVKEVRVPAQGAPRLKIESDELAGKDLSFDDRQRLVARMLSDRSGSDGGAKPPSNGVHSND